MGIELWMKCSKCGHSVGEAGCAYNLAPMWSICFPDDEQFAQLEMLTGKDSLEKLNRGISIAIEKKSELEKLNPEKGLGSCSCFLHFLQKLRQVAEDNPTCHWEAWR